MYSPPDWASPAFFWLYGRCVSDWIRLSAVGGRRTARTRSRGGCVPLGTVASSGGATAGISHATAARTAQVSKSDADDRGPGCLPARAQGRRSRVTAPASGSLELGSLWSWCTHTSVSYHGLVVCGAYVLRRCSKQMASALAHGRPLCQSHLREVVPAQRLTITGRCCLHPVWS